MQEIGKIDFKINILPSGLENYMNSNLDNKLVFIDSFQFLDSLLYKLIKNIGKK